MSEVQEYDYVRFAVPDMHGTSRGRVVPARHAHRCFETGVSVNGGFVMLDFAAGGVSQQKNDPQNDRLPLALLKPDMTSLYNIAWCGGERSKVVEVICDSFWLDDLTPQLQCPRHVTRVQLQRLSDQGFELLSGFEMEFYLQTESKRQTSDYTYMSLREITRHGDFLFKMNDLLHRAGVDIESFHCEYGSGAFEAVMKPLWGLATVDSAFKFKNGTKEIADGIGYEISYDNDKDYDFSTHFNHSLWSKLEKRNVFQDSQELSYIGRHWLAGLMKHARALTAFLSPTVNCYSRLNKPHRPGVIFWGTCERSACVRVKQSCPEKGVYLENRMPSAMSNPYLVLAATVAAGLDGVLNKLECPPQRMNPNNEFTIQCSLQGNKASEEHLPSSLSESVCALLEDKVLVESLGKEFVDWHVAAIKSNNDL